VLALGWGSGADTRAAAWKGVTHEGGGCPSSVSTARSASRNPSAVVMLGPQIAVYSRKKKQRFAVYSRESGGNGSKGIALRGRTHPRGTTVEVFGMRDLGHQLVDLLRRNRGHSGKAEESEKEAGG